MQLMLYHRLRDSDSFSQPKDSLLLAYSKGCLFTYENNLSGGIDYE